MGLATVQLGVNRWVGSRHMCEMAELNSVNLTVVTPVIRGYNGLNINSENGYKAISMSTENDSITDCV